MTHGGHVTESIFCRVSSSLARRLAGAELGIGGLGASFREVGRVERTLFMIEWTLDLGMQRCAQLGLNKGESHHALKNALRIGRQGEFRDRTTEGQHYRIAGLNLLAAIVIYWNTVRLGEAVAGRRRAGLPVPSELAHISPLCWAHILLIGEYRWRRRSRQAASEREETARCFRLRAALWPFAMALAGVAGVWLTTSEFYQTMGADVLGGALRGVLVAGVAVAVLVFISQGRLPSAYRTPEFGEEGLGAECVAGLFGVVSLVLGVVAGVSWPQQVLKELRAIVKSGVRRVGHAAALLSSMSSIPSLNLTPSMSFASWRNPRSRRQDFSAHRPIL